MTSRGAVSAGFWSRRVNWVGLLALAWLVCIDALTLVPIGGQSASALATLGTATVLLAMAPTLVPPVARRFKEAGEPRGVNRLPLSLLGFLCYALVRFLVSPSMPGLQNVCVYAAFVLAVALVADSANISDGSYYARYMPLAAAVVSGLFLALRTAGIALFGDRSYALSAVVFMALAVPQRRGWSRHLPYLVLLATVVSLSRTATFICLMAYVFIVVRGPREGRARKVGLMLGALVLAVAALLMWYPPFRDRFISGDNAVSVGGTSLNTSGRTQLWELTWNSAMDAPWWGQGPGTASALIDMHFSNIGHPHNEYLRLLHDFGAVGLGLWCWGLITLGVHLWRKSRRTDAPVVWSGFIAVMGIVLGSVTDNVIIYPFVMVPAGALVGFALAHEPGCTTRYESESNRRGKSDGAE